MLNFSANGANVLLKKTFGTHQVPLINPKNGQRELTTPEIKTP